MRVARRLERNQRALVDERSFDARHLRVVAREPLDPLGARDVRDRSNPIAKSFVHRRPLATILLSRVSVKKVRPRAKVGAPPTEWVAATSTEAATPAGARGPCATLRCACAAS